MSKFKKILTSPGVFLRDWALKRHPLLANEISCPIGAERVVIDRDLALFDGLAGNMEVDIVYTWVDSTDPAWKNRFDSAIKITDPDLTSTHALDPARFECHRELAYSVKSVLKFLPWARKIYIVTDKQKPDWDLSDEKVVFVDHEEIIDPEYRPTFNSHVIEANLHRIPGLAEHFIYFNDDVFVARRIPKEHFFINNGLSAMFLSDKHIPLMQRKGLNTATLSAAQRSADLLHNRYGYMPTRPLVHTYVPLRRKAYELAWSSHEHTIRSFLGNRFRSHNDLNLATFLVPWTSFLEGMSFPANDICHYFNIRSASAKTAWKILLDLENTPSAPHSFCANDFHVAHSSTSNNKLEENLKAYYRH